MRIKESWKSKVQHVARGQFTRTFLAGTDLDGMLQKGTLLLDGRAIDADVTLGSGAKKVHCRLCGVPAPDGSYRFYFTNLPP